MAKAALQNKKQNVVTKKVQAKRSTKMETKKSEKVVELKKSAEVKTEPKTENNPEQKKDVKPVQEVKKEVKPEENKKTELRVVETPQMTAVEALKSNKNFETFMKDVPPAIISELAQYPAAQGKEIIEIAELTQNVNSFMEVFKKNRDSHIIIWVVNTIKPELLIFADTLNERTDNNFGIFIFKADLKGSGMTFECVLKPVYKEKKSKAIGNDFNLTYWKKYYEIAKTLQSKINAKPNDRQFKTISAGKTGVAIMQTVSREKLQVSSEIYIADNKETYDKLFAKKAQIEKEAETKLEWLRLDNKKASRIVARINADLLDNVKMQSAINKQIKMGETLQAIVKKYL